MFVKPEIFQGVTFLLFSYSLISGSYNLPISSSVIIPETEEGGKNLLLVTEYSTDPYFPTQRSSSDKDFFGSERYIYLLSERYEI